MSKSKMRVSMHSGRERSAKHNDRSFLCGKSQDWIEEHAPHIDITKTPDNCYWTWNGSKNFLQSEQTFYHNTFAAGQEQSNARYIKQGHRDKCKTTEDLYKDEKTGPEEVILQIGDKDSNVDPELFKQCVQEYMQQLQNWSDKHGKCLHLMSMACHFDEASPHAHLSRCWTYKDKWGFARIGQNAALKAAGIELPNPDKPEGRHNNRKMSFDAMARGMWQDICKSHGLEIETEPLPNKRTYKKSKDFFYGKMQEMLDAAEKAREQAAALEKTITILDKVQQEQAETATSRHGLFGYHLIPDEQYQTLSKAAAGQQAALDGLHEQIDALQQGYEQQLEAIDEMRKQAQREIGEQQLKVSKELTAVKRELEAERREIEKYQEILDRTKEELDSKPLLKIWRVQEILDKSAGSSMQEISARAELKVQLDKSLKSLADQIISQARAKGLNRDSLQELDELKPARKREKGLTR